MAELQDQINSILSNPQMMQQIMSIAGSMGQQSQSAPVGPTIPQSTPASAASQGIPFDPAAMQGMMELLRGTQLDSRQQNLLRALGAYLPHEKMVRLQKAMQASKVARYASSALNHGQTGR